MIVSIEKILNDLSQSTDLPLLTALLLGLTVALNPCQLAINISALTYLANNDKFNRVFFIRGLLYALGRMTTYSILGWLLMLIISSGLKIDFIQYILSKAEVVVPYFLLLLAVLFLYRAFHRHHHNDSCHNSKQIIHANGKFGAFVLGVLLAFAFCPESAVFYFGMMLPLGLTSHIGWLIPLFFSLAAIFPVLVIAFFISRTMMSSARRFEHRMETFQMAINIMSAIIFMLLAIWLLAV